MLIILEQYGTSVCVTYILFLPLGRLLILPPSIINKKKPPPRLRTLYSYELSSVHAKER